MLVGLFILLGLATLLVLLAYIGVVAYEVRRPTRRTAGWALAHNRISCPSDLGLAFENWQLDTRDGPSLPVWDIPAETADSINPEDEDTPVVVVLHGWGRSRIDSLARMAFILRPDPRTPRDFRTILYELRGHGDAPTGPTTLGSRDVADLDALVERLGRSPVILVGHSLGAVVAIHAAVRNPEQVRAVIALSPYDRLATPIGGSLRMRGCPGGILANAVGLLLALRGVRVESTIEAAARMRQPLDVLVGEQDRITPPSVAKPIADAAPHGRFEVIPNVGHSDHHERAPERLRAALDRALAAARSVTNEPI